MSRLGRIGLALALCLTVFAGMTPAASAKPVTVKTPVLLVPGLTSEPELWASWISPERTVATNGEGFKLVAGPHSGGDSDVFGENVPMYALDRTWDQGQYGDIPGAARAIPWAIDRILEEHPEQGQVFVVTHSTGGLLARYYLAGMLPAGESSRKYKGDIAGLVALDTPHRGWAYAQGGIAKDLYSAQLSTVADTQVSADSAVVTTLNASPLRKGPLYEFVAGNYYPLLGDGVLTLEEQIPSTARLDEPKRMTVVDAPHDTKVAAWYRLQLTVASGVEPPAKPPALPAVADSDLARSVALDAYNAVATEYQEDDTPVKTTAVADAVLGTPEMRASLIRFIRAVVDTNDFDYHPNKYSAEYIRFVKMGTTWWAGAMVIPTNTPRLRTSYLPIIAKRVGTRWRLVAVGYDMTPQAFPDVPILLWQQMNF